MVKTRKKQTSTVQACGATVVNDAVSYSCANVLTLYASYMNGMTLHSTDRCHFLEGTI